MSLRSISKNVQKFTIDNSPLILTAIGVTGTITTAILTHRAALKADVILNKAERRAIVEDEPLTRKDKFELLWQIYLPPVTSATLTCAAIICANRIGTRRAAAVAAAYSISEKAFTEYREKVVTKLGEKQEKAVRDEIAQDRVRNNPPNERDIFLTGTNEVLCLDNFSGRYFMCDMETLKKAQNDINYQILHNDYATVSNFYNNIGLDTTSISDEMGWNTDKLLELHFSATLVDDNKPCMVVDFAVVPVRDPWRFC